VLAGMTCSEPHAGSNNLLGLWQTLPQLTLLQDKKMLVQQLDLLVQLQQLSYLQIAKETCAQSSNAYNDQ